MIELTIPGRGTLKLEYLVCDVNGTLTLDGELIEGVSRLMERLKDKLSIHLISADTLGRLDTISQLLGVNARRLQAGNEAEQKAEFVRHLGADSVAAVGQGANDGKMLKEAALGITLLSREGTSIQTLQQADILMPDIVSALELFEKPIRIIATLRQ